MLQAEEARAATVWLGFAAMCLGMFMAILDIQVVASSLTAIQAALHIPLSQLGWIQTAYLMAEVVAIPLTGLLTGALSLRLLFALATSGFVVASLACALSPDFAALIAARVAQGFFGGMLIPSVFTAVFVLIPRPQQVLATTLAGIAALLAPTLGPLLGGWLTETRSWHWIFLINIPPGAVVACAVLAFLRKTPLDFAALRRLDIATLILFAVFLAGLQWLLHEGPVHHWRGALIWGLTAGVGFAFVFGIKRALSVSHPFVDLKRFGQRGFAAGCGLSFVLGLGLYGSVYLLSLFLGVVRGHAPLAIGMVLVVSGGAQLLTAPVAAWAETRANARLLTGFGFALFGVGLIANGFTTIQSDFDALFWPQVLRGLAMMFCLLPATRLALDGWPPGDVAEASGLFNLMRNLGGAIGIAMIDTVMQSRTEAHAAAIGARLQAGDAAMARLVGLPTATFRGHDMGPVDPITRAMVRPLVERTALTQSLNEAWFLLAALFLLALLSLPLLKKR